MRIKDMIPKNQKKNFIIWGIKAKYYGILFRIFRSEKALNKSVKYLDKRWYMMLNIANKYGFK